jgi:TATA-binding protein-associated factor
MEGISWMATLSSYNLNFALCDDMGLGKTVQTLCLLLNESKKK